MREEVNKVGEGRISHNEEPYGLYLSSNIIRTITSRRMR
jgi:hypothetical protein